MHKPKILHIIGRPSIGGVQKLVLGLSTNPELGEFDHIILSINSEAGGMVPVYRAKGVPIYSCIRKKVFRKYIPSYSMNEYINDLYFLIGLLSKMRSLAIDLVHLQQAYYLRPQISVIRKLSKPFICTLHGVHEEIPNTQYIAETINSSPAMLTGVAKAVLEKSPLYDIVDQAKQVVIYNGIDLLFYQEFISTNEIRSQLGISPKSIVFGSAASFLPVKRHDIFIKAASTIIEKGYDCHFFLAGEGPLKAELENLVGNLNLQDKFHFMEWQPDIRKFFTNIDVFVLPSDSEGCSVALLEAMAMAKPCIVTAVGGNSEVLGENGKLISPASPFELSLAMEDLLDSNLRKYYSESARLNSLRFDINKTSGLYKDLYKQLL